MNWLQNGKVPRVGTGMEVNGKVVPADMVPVSTYLQPDKLDEWTQRLKAQARGQHADAITSDLAPGAPRRLREQAPTAAHRQRPDARP